MKGRIVGSMLAWLAAVATVAGIATIAIGTAGRQVRPQLLASSSPLAVPEAVQSTPVTDGGASGYGEASSGGSGADTPASAGQSGGGAAPVLRERAVRAAGGHVQARCTGRRVAGYALPDDGWQARISATAQRRLEVVFSFGAERAVLVTAVCEADGPTFRQADLDPRGPVRTVRGPGGGQPDPTVTQISPAPAPSTGASVPTKPGKPTPSGTTTAPTPTSGLPSSSVPSSSPPASTATSTATSSATSSATASAVGAPEESPSPSGTTADRSRSGSSDPVEASPTVPVQCTPDPADPSVPLPRATPSDTVGAAPGPEEGAGCATAEPGGPTLGM